MDDAAVGDADLAHAISIPLPRYRENPIIFTGDVTRSEPLSDEAARPRNQGRTVIFTPDLGAASRRRSAAWTCDFPRRSFCSAARRARQGTQTQFISAARGLTCPPVVISDLLTTPEMEKLKSQGVMVGDKKC
jgi:hypothetical protein